MRIAIRGIGAAGGFGCGADQLQRTLLSGENKPQIIVLEAESRKIEFPVFICNTDRLEDFVNKKALRRVDHFSRMAILASALALKDAGWHQEDRQRIAVVVASGYGAARTTFFFLDSAIDNGDALASPTMFSNSVHNASAAYISILLNVKGPNLTVSQFEMSVPSALVSACCWLQDNQVDAVIFGGVDEYSSVLGYSWQRFFGQGGNIRMRPLELENQSAIAGEGAAFLLLTRDDGDKPKYGYIKDVQFGRTGISKPEIAKNTLLILGADGHKSAGIHYARQIQPTIQAAIYSPLYGSIPIGPAFDMVIAALSIREGRIFATANFAGDNPGLNIVCKDEELNSKPICCLKFSCKGEFGMIEMASE